MLEPCRAAVRPRGVDPRFPGTPLLLEEELADCLWDERFVFEIVGGPRMGKTTALRHLAAAFPGANVRWLDDATLESVQAEAKIAAGAIVYASLAPLEFDAVRSLTLWPWSEDDAIEYLLARHPRECASVVA